MRATLATRTRILLSIILALTFTSSVALAQSLGPSGPAGPSPAVGHASVIAQGVIAPAAGELTWKVIAREATSEGETITMDTTGFIVPNRSPILVVEQDFNRTTRLAAGEAMLVRTDQQLTISSFGPPEEYVLLAIGTPDEAPAGTLVYESPAFEVDGSARDMDLLRDVLSAGEQSLIQLGFGPTIVYVTRGEATISAASGETILTAGTAAVFGESISVIGGSDGATFVAGYIGTGIDPDVDETPITEIIPTEPPATPSTTVEPSATAEPTQEPTATPTQPEATAAIDPELDSDEDGITDVQEVNLGTDPNNLDTDGDLLYDGGEMLRGTDPFNPDTDGDGLTDGEEEYFTETDPANPDSDGDGINDYREVEEFGTDPNNADTDGDGVNDYNEIFGAGSDPGTGGSGDVQSSCEGGNPGTVAGELDSDRDGLSDESEPVWGTDPCLWDTDGDGINDSNEVGSGSDPLDPNDWP